MDPFSEGMRALLRDVLSAYESRIEEITSRAVEKALAAQAETYQPLHHLIPNLTPKAAWARLQRDPELRKAGVMIGKRLMFKRSDLDAYLKTKNSAR